MASPTVAVVVGNPRSGSRTSAAATLVAERLAGAVGADGAPLVVELAEHAARLFDPEDAELAGLTAAVASSSVCVVASPTFKASYTGLLKAFLDRYGDGGLTGVVAIPMMIGAAPNHALAPEVHLRPVLVELGAVTPTRALYVLESQLPDLERVVAGWLANTGGAVQRAIAA